MDTIEIVGQEQDTEKPKEKVDEIPDDLVDKLLRVIFDL